jgi:hypothetical protein
VEELCPTSDDLVDAGASACLSTQAIRHRTFPSFSPDAQSPQPRRASHDSPLEAGRDL